MPPPRAIPCPMCGEGFFKASLPFHLKSCEQKQANLIVPCPYCQFETRKGDLPAHMATCKKRPKQHTRTGQPGASFLVPPSSARAAHGAGSAPAAEPALARKLAGMGVKQLRALATEANVDLRHCVEKDEMVDALMRNNAGASQARAHMPAAPPDDAWAADAAGISGGRMECSVCGRRFALDRCAPCWTRDALHCVGPLPSCLSLSCASSCSPVLRACAPPDVDGADTALRCTQEFASAWRKRTEGGATASSIRGRRG